MVDHINILRSGRLTLVSVSLDREYEKQNETKILQDAIRELQKEVIRLKNLAF